MHARGESGRDQSAHMALLFLAAQACVCCLAVGDWRIPALLRRLPTALCLPCPHRAAGGPQHLPGAGHQPAGAVGHARPARRGAGVCVDVRVWLVVVGSTVHLQRTHGYALQLNGLCHMLQMQRGPSGCSRLAGRRHVRTSRVIAAWPALSLPSTLRCAGDGIAHRALRGGEGLLSRHQVQLHGHLRCGQRAQRAHLPRHGCVCEREFVCETCTAIRPSRHLQPCSPPRAALVHASSPASCP